MKNNKLNKIKLDKYEKSLEDALERGEFVRVGDFEKSKKSLIEAAQNTVELQRTKRITLRVKNSDLLKVKFKAQKHQIPYQRLINALIHQYAEGLTHIII
ncbi:hypothetical protein A2960_05725 [Candidatus Gottesmanbacteria bacterium RIFCSPLOWO2_01_FULL_39_12b]|uniref:Antitoxin n=1 Tax=Candidatus Gottesmanbacteria bacterium RIFCSPLOWO2_01_FULL_39_12b TaxID=1798388 RepID=A0A1F6AMV7_9BACT|nr:MAG: hypothetical protein A2960_05725 [Candidatus Gottesmanbacteria bacterium RIFCSPLOWO2_01_FULL_39_12b]